jgi:hypothetical protein
LISGIAIAVFARLSGSTSIAGQEATAPAKKTQHHHYNFSVISALGGIFGEAWGVNRHRGTGHPASPATPPDMRVRIRRFGGLS